MMRKDKKGSVSSWEEVISFLEIIRDSQIYFLGIEILGDIAYEFRDVQLALDSFTRIYKDNEAALTIFHMFDNFTQLEAKKVKFRQRSQMRL
jgi:hypothetical protein